MNIEQVIETADARIAEAERAAKIARDLHVSEHSIDALVTETLTLEVWKTIRAWATQTGDIDSVKQILHDRVMYIRRDGSTNKTTQLFEETRNVLWIEAMRVIIFE